MKTAAAFLFALVLGSLTVTSKGFGQPFPGPRINGASPASASCPVEVKAQQEIGGGDLVAIDEGRPKGTGQQLHLMFTNSKSVKIVALKITIHGSAGKGSLLPTRVVEANSPEATKTLDLKLTVGGQRDASTDLWVSGLTAISRIDLDNVTYVDGSKWRSSALETCHFRPDGAMLISSR